MKTRARKDFQFEVNRFETINTKDSPATMEEGQLPVLINFVPIGTSAYTAPSHKIPHANAKTPVGTTVKKMFSVNIGGVIYMLAVTTDGAMYWFNVDDNWDRIKIADAGTFSAPQFEQWKTDGCIIADTTGYFKFFGDNGAVTNCSKAAGVLVQSVGTPAKLQSTATITYAIGFAIYTAAAADPLVTTGSFTCSTGKSNRAYIYIDSVGAFSLAQGTEGATLADVVMPARDATKACVGILNITNASGAPYTYGTTSLTATNITYDVVQYQIATNLSVLGSTANGLTLRTATGEYVISSVPAAATAVANWKTRAWLVVGNKRSAQYSAPLEPFDFRVLTTGGIVVDPHPSLRNTIVNLAPTGEYLYLVGDHGTHTIYGLQVLDSGAVIFSLSDSCPGAGGLWPDTIIPYSNTVFMMGDVGMRAVAGTEAELFSSMLDGLYITLDTTSSPAFSPVACLGKILNKLCYVVLFRVKSLLDGSLTKYLACFYENKWFLIDYYSGSAGINLMTLCMSYTNLDTVVYGSYGNQITQLFYRYEVALQHLIKTKSDNFGTPLTDKQALRIGAIISSVEPLTTQLSANMAVYGNTASAQAVVRINPEEVVWVNNVQSPVAWDGIWVTNVYDLLGSSQIDGRGKRLQFSYEETSAQNYILTGIIVEGQYGAEW